MLRRRSVDSSALSRRTSRNYRQIIHGDSINVRNECKLEKHLSQPCVLQSSSTGQLKSRCEQNRSLLESWSKDNRDYVTRKLVMDATILMPIVIK
ncbi:unnamed protein product [Dracunculus medinensis]|uniref:Uncharacterized protein n=1 Tax=Dracunculus medinensis TaxID=318479 RepID=A0A0N4U4X3_DRAME|nr:unnamed protein product [Dracunculus medinensis]